MTLHQNIHPNYRNGKAASWSKITANFASSKLGACVTLCFEDQDREEATICIHYAEVQYAQEFVDMLKIAILSLPAIVGEDA